MLHLPYCYGVLVEWDTGLLESTTGTVEKYILEIMYS